MPAPNDYPVNPEQETFAHQVMVQFNDGEMALGFRTPGDKLPLGHGSGHKYARDFDLDSMAIIKTSSGNVYSLAGGLLINKNGQKAFKLPEENIQVIIGEPCVIPGVGTTTKVENVLIRYKSAAPGSQRAEEQIDEPSPFKALEALVEAVQTKHQLA